MKACFLERNGNTWEMKKKNIGKDGIVKIGKKRKIYVGSPNEKENKAMTGMMKGWKTEDKILGKWFPLYFISNDRAMPMLYFEKKKDSAEVGFSLETMSQENFSNFLDGKAEEQLTTIKSDKLDQMFYIMIGAAVGGMAGFMIAGGDLSGIVSEAKTFMPLCLCLGEIKNHPLVRKLLRK